MFKELSEKISDSELQVSNLKFSSILKFKTEILAGLTVALALVPEAVYIANRLNKIVNTKYSFSIDHIAKKNIMTDGIKNKNIANPLKK